MKTSKKVLSIFLSLLMVALMLPIAAVPASAEGEPFSYETETIAFTYYSDTKTLTAEAKSSANVFGLSQLESFYEAYAGAIENPFVKYCYSNNGIYYSIKYTYMDGYEAFIASVKVLNIIGFSKVTFNKAEYTSYYKWSKEDHSAWNPRIDEISFNSLSRLTKLILDSNAIVTRTSDDLIDSDHKNNWKLTVKGECTLKSYAYIGTYYDLFGACTKLTEVTFSGDSQKTVGSLVFKNCASLNTLSLAGVVDIGEEAFANCTALASVTVPATVTTLGDYAFSGCTALTSADLSCETVGAAAFADTPLSSLVLRSGVKKINSWAFSGTQIGGAVTIPSTVTEIGSCAFYGCGITNLYFSENGENLQSIGISAFANNNLSGTLTLGGNQLVLNDKVFAGNAITSVNFTDVVYQLDGDPFVGNPITEIRFNEDDTQVFNTTRIGSNDPAEVDVYTEWQTPSCTWATENGYNVILASGSYWYLTPVSTDAADGLTLVITGNVPSFINGGWPWSDVDDSIGDYAPYIKRIVIDGAVSTLGDRAFANCTALESITVSDFVTSIGFNAIPSDATIICTNGSAAYDYAQQHGNPVVTDYTVQVSYSAPERLSGTPVSGGGTFTSGTSVTVTASRLATPVDPYSTNGYDFDGWYIVAMNGMPLRRPLLVSSELTYTFTVNADVTLSASYKVHEPNNYIEVEGFREPIAGETPNKKITLPDGTQISGKLKVKDGENYVNVSGAYEAGREYMIMFLLTDAQATAPYVKIRGQFVELDTLQGGGKAFTVSFVAHNFTVEETLAATCIDDGERLYTSTDPDYVCTFTEVIPATGHTEAETVVLQPGCDYTGLKDVYCSVCGAPIRTESIDAVGHTYGTWIDEIAAVDCANPGIVGHYNCGECGKNFDAEYNELETVLVEIPHNLGLIGDSTPSCTSNWINYPERPDIVSVELCSECNAACINYTNRDPIIVPFGEYNDSADLAAIEAHWSIHNDTDCDYICDLCGETIAHTCIDDDGDCLCDLCGAQLEHTWSFVYDTAFSCEHPYVDWPENTNFASAEICTNCGAARINYVSGDPRVIAADDVATDEEVLALDAHMKQHDWRQVYDTTPICDDGWINWPENTNFASADYCDACNRARINYVSGDPRIIEADDVATDEEVLALEAHMTIHYDADCNYVCDLCGEIFDHTCVDNNNDCICDFCGAQLAHDWRLVYDTTFSCERPYIDWPENTTFASAEICNCCTGVRINYVSGESRIIAADDVATDEEVLALEAHMKQHDWTFVYDTTPICDDGWINWPENTNFASADYCDACGSARINYVSGDPRIVAADDIATDEEIAALEAHMAIHYDADSNGFCDLCDAGIGDNAGFTLLPTADSEELAYGAYWFNMEGAKEYQLSLYEPGTSDYNETNYMFNIAVIGISDDGNTLRFVSHDARNNPIIIVVYRDEPDLGELWFSHLHQHGIGPVELEDPTTEVTVTAEAGVIPENTALVVVPDAQVANFVIGNGTVENYNHEAFDISLEDANGNEVQPQGGSVTVKLPIPVGYDKSSIKVYFVDDNGNKTDMNATVEGDYAVFTVDHFSKYVLVDETCLHNGETEVRDAVKANCHTEGYTGDTYCMICGDKIADGTNNGKDMTKHDGATEIRDAVTGNCHVDGYTGDTWCLGCNTKIASGTNTGKDMTKHDGATEIRGAVTANCHVEGYTGDTWCLGCNTKIASGTSTGKDSTKHDGATEIRGAMTANCHVEGYTGDTWCLGCNTKIATGTNTGKDASKHDGGTEVRNAKAATCKTDGYTGDTYCKGCNNKIASGSTISKDTIAHTRGPIVKENVVNATTEHGGSYDEVVRCTVCNKVLSSTHKTTDKLPSQPQSNPNACKWCGKEHNGFFQKIVAFFHNILASIFGAKY